MQLIFIKVPIVVINKEDEEESAESWTKINPLMICDYRPNIADSETLNLTMAGGSSFLVYMSIKNFEILLNNWRTKQ
jgi:hypothetical protein